MRIVIERRLAGGRTIRAAVESMTTEGHSALTSVRESGAINIALVNVLDVTQDAISKIGHEPVGDRTPLYARPDLGERGDRR